MVPEAAIPQGYYFPAEWEHHRATWISWPHNANTWPGDIQSIFDGYIQFIKIVSRYEQVCINLEGEKMELDARTRLSRAQVDLGKISFYHHATNDAWCRDHGPCFLINAEGNKMILDWGYNAWGGKYPPYDFDDAIPSQVANSLNLPCIRPGLILEGGSVDFNSLGTVLTTKSCLLNRNRNPNLSIGEVEQKLKRYFGVNQVLWLEEGITGDDTDGHIDTITRFVDANTVVTVIENDAEEINYDPLQKNLAALRKMQLSDGQPLKVLSLPMPAPRYHHGQRLPASYANFYICNGAVIVPTYQDPNDDKALSILADLFKDREVIGVDSTEIIRGLGSFHCLCMQEPGLQDYLIT